jgi:hypothetical protein
MEKRILVLNEAIPSDVARAAAAILSSDSATWVFEYVALADLVLEQLAAAAMIVAAFPDPGAAYVLGIAHGIGKPAIVIVPDGYPLPLATALRPVFQPAAMRDPRQLAAAVETVFRTPVAFPVRAVPLADILEPATIAEPVRRYLEEHGVMRAADLDRLDLPKLAAAPGVTRQALTVFVRSLARSERHPKPDVLQDFLISRGIFL